MLKTVHFLCLRVIELLLLVLLLLEGAQVATSVVAGVAGRSLHCYISTNQQSKFQTSSPLFFSFSFYCAKTRSWRLLKLPFKKQKNKNFGGGNGHRCQVASPWIAAMRACNATTSSNIVASCSVTSSNIAASCSVASSNITASCSTISYSTASCSVTSCNAASLQRHELATLAASGACNVYSSTTLHCHRPSSRSSRAFYDAITSNVTLLIFVYPRTFVHLGTSIKHPSIQGHSSHFRPLNLCPSTNFRSTFNGLSSN